LALESSGGMRLTLKVTGRGTPRTVRPAIAGAVLRRLMSDTDDTRAQSSQPTDLGEGRPCNT
jgi:hypothetical protein